MPAWAAARILWSRVWPGYWLREMLAIASLLGAILEFSFGIEY